MKKPESLSDRPTAFVTILNATEEDMHQFQKLMNESVINEYYRIMVTNKVLQVMSAEEILQQLEMMYQIQTQRPKEEMNEMILHTTQSFLEVVEAIQKIEQSINTVESAIQSLASQVQSCGILISTPYITMPAIYGHISEIRHRKDMLSSVIKPKEEF